MSDGRDVIVIGAGIVGVSAAALLAEAGHKVTVLDRSGIAEETSRGNAAALAFSDIMPLASPKIMRRAPRWLLDPLGPLAIRPAYLPKLTPWLWQFWRASQPSRVEASILAQASLMQLAEREALALYERAGLSSMIRHDGSLELYESETEFRAAAPGWQRREKAGIAIAHLRGGELADLQPGLAPSFVAGTFVPGWKTVSDPHSLALRLWDHAERHGARFERAGVRALERDGYGTRLVMEDGSRRAAARIVVAAGAWSTRLLGSLTGPRIPLETERGYATTLPVGAFDVRRQLIFGGHGFVITPLETGLRVAGTVELAGLDLPPNFDRARTILDKASRFLPGLKPEGGTQWMGYRPSLPDSLPVMGELPGAPGVILAFGNGHLGLTQSAAMGRLAADLVAGKAPSIDIRPFRPDRF
ncbi:glycine/D-amino acid oxidase-like deaminating enzyme [Hoeflea marina]|uniref:Glycine/D-amino acid oxidase-like deaminating enzyme n=1 Tax=Hoeflea marina TaxID=274592 RepID=A0A317PCU7_9HYPH|nr:FAD-dependent oxidoreductase [Hoeflea marina]PWV97151.1 glycine/D-amino acid oxidase-like deaminating enzyme [Hoeflea marina]